MISRPVALLIGFALSSVVVLLTPQGKRIVSAVGCGFVVIGTTCLLTGQLPQRWGFGPPIEGSFATLCSLLLLGYGVYCILLAFLSKSDGQIRGDDQTKT